MQIQHSGGKEEATNTTKEPAGKSVANDGALLATNEEDEGANERNLENAAAEKQVAADKGEASAQLQVRLTLPQCVWLRMSKFC